MAESQGWVKLHRSISDTRMWTSEPFTRAQAWIDLFLNANHKPGIMIVRGNIVNIGRGQIGWSELTMSKRWRWSRNKVRRYLTYLQGVGNVEQQKSSVTTVITIIDYELYQGCDTADDTTDGTTERQQKDNRRYTNKNVKNGKNEKKKRNSPPTPREKVEMISPDHNLVAVFLKQAIELYESKLSAKYPKPYPKMKTYDSISDAIDDCDGVEGLIERYEKWLDDASDTWVRDSLWRIGPFVSRYGDYSDDAIRLKNRSVKSSTTTGPVRFSKEYYDQGEKQIREMEATKEKNRMEAKNASKTL